VEFVQFGTQGQTPGGQAPDISPTSCAVNGEGCSIT
jgi:hypothetical protein